MADSNETSSSDESVINEVQAFDSGILPYQFEPINESSVDESSSESISSSESNSDREAAAGAVNLAQLDRPTDDWCTCGRCSTETLRRDKECVCCQDKPWSRVLTRRHNEEDSTCIIHHEEFGLLCLTPAVLRNVLDGLNNTLADNWHVNPPNTSGFRYAAYRQFSWWAHGKLGPSRRRVLPACAVHSIRKAFPAAPGEEYRGFLSGEEDSN